MKVLLITTATVIAMVMLYVGVSDYSYTQHKADVLDTKNICFVKQGFTYCFTE